MPFGSLPDIEKVPVHPVLQTPCSEYSWVRVTFHGEQAPTRSEVFRTMQLLEMMHNFWDKEDDSDGTNNQDDQSSTG